MAALLLQWAACRLEREEKVCEGQDNRSSTVEHAGCIASNEQLYGRVWRPLKALTQQSVFGCQGFLTNSLHTVFDPFRGFISTHPKEVVAVGEASFS